MTDEDTELLKLTTTKTTNTKNTNYDTQSCDNYKKRHQSISNLAKADLPAKTWQNQAAMFLYLTIGKIPPPPLARGGCVLPHNAICREYS